MVHSLLNAHRIGDLGAVGSRANTNTTGRRLVLPPKSRAGPPPRAAKLSSRDRRIQGLEDLASAIDAKSHNPPTHRDRNFPEDLLAVPATHPSMMGLPFVAEKHVPFLFPSPKTFITSGHAPVACFSNASKVVSIHCKFHDHQSGALPGEVQGSHTICSELFLANPASTPERKRSTG